MVSILFKLVESPEESIGVYAINYWTLLGYLSVFDWEFSVESIRRSGAPVSAVIKHRRPIIHIGGTHIHIDPRPDAGSVMDVIDESGNFGYCVRISLGIPSRSSFNIYRQAIAIS